MKIVTHFRVYYFLVSEDNTALHVVVAVDSEVNWCYIVTVFTGRSSEHFELDYAKDIRLGQNQKEIKLKMFTRGGSIKPGKKNVSLK